MRFEEGFKQESQNIQCPYCWQSIEILVDTSQPQQTYVEDCQVCCHPILLQVTVDQFTSEDSEINIQVTREND